MKRSLPLVASLFAALAFVSTTREARADVIRPHQGSGEQFGIAKGVKEIGLETLFVMGYDKVGDASSLRLSLVAGPTFRYFIIDNVNLTLNVSGFYKRESGAATQSDYGVQGTVGANYYAHLSGDMYFVPGIGVGGFWGKRQTDVTTPGMTAGTTTTTQLASTLVGGLGRIGFGLTYYASDRFALSARPEAIIAFGKATPDAGGDGQTFIGIDGGFNVGLTYVF